MNLKNNELKWYDAEWFMWVLLIIVPYIGIPFMWIKKKDYSKSKKKKLSIIFGIWCVIVFAIAFTQEDTNLNNTNNSNNQIEEQNTNYFVDEIVNNDVRENFIKAAKDIKIDLSKVKDLKKIEDWNAGERYSFQYYNTQLLIYTNMDNSINSIKLGLDNDIYKQGYEPYDINDYIPNSDVTLELNLLATDKIESQLNYPNTADFDWMGWQYSRNKNIYYVSNSLTAENAFGVEEEISFVLAYEVVDSNYNLKYFLLNGSELINELNIVEEERQKLEVENNDDNDSKLINIKYGELGTVGETITLDGDDYINYILEEGTYKLTNNAKIAKVYIASDDYYKNSSGYMENEILETIELTTYKETKTFTIKNGYHLEVTVNGDITLEKID